MPIFSFEVWVFDQQFYKSRRVKPCRDEQFMLVVVSVEYLRLVGKLHFVQPVQHVLVKNVEILVFRGWCRDDTCAVLYRIVTNVVLNEVKVLDDEFRGLAAAIEDVCFVDNDDDWDSKIYFVDGFWKLDLQPRIWDLDVWITLVSRLFRYWIFVYYLPVLVSLWVLIQFPVVCHTCLHPIKLPNF